jgi:hypothetical protein
MKPPEAERLIDRFEELAEHEMEAILKRYKLCQKVLLLRDEQYLVPKHRTVSPIHIVKVLTVAVLYPFHFECFRAPDRVSFFHEIPLLLVNPHPDLRR